MFLKDGYVELWGVLGALLISTISGFISISRRVLQGHAVSVLWIISEYLTAVLCGVLTYYTYPSIADQMPVWITQPVAVAFAAHVGGRFFQEAEKAFITHYARILGGK